MNKLWLIVIAVIIVAVSVQAYRGFDLSKYREECYSYRQVPYNLTQYYCDSRYRYLMLCPDSMQEIVTYNRSRMDCNCPNVAARNVTFYKNGNCVKYHLVRDGGGT